MRPRSPVGRLACGRAWATRCPSHCAARRLGARKGWTARSRCRSRSGSCAGRATHHPWRRPPPRRSRRPSCPGWSNGPAADAATATAAGESTRPRTRWAPASSRGDRTWHAVAAAAGTPAGNRRTLLRRRVAAAAAAAGVAATDHPWSSSAGKSKRSGRGHCRTWLADSSAPQSCRNG